MTMLKGLSAFPITPSDAGGRIDAAALGRLVARLVEAEVGSIGLLGSTGTYMYLSRAEKRRAIEAAQVEAAGKVPLLVGVGALRSDEAIALAQDAKALGAAAGLLSAASYTPLTADEMFAHTEVVARESGLPIVLYDNPGTTHFTFTPELVARLARLPGVIGIKNPPPASGAVAAHLSAQRALVGPEFSIGYSGDWCGAEAMLAGAEAWYSVLGGTFPKACLGITRAAAAGDAAEALARDAELAPLWDLFRRHSSIRVVYEIARQLGLSEAEPPRPLLPLGEPARAEIAAVLAALPERAKE